MLLFRRSIAILVELGILLAITVACLLWDSRTNILYGWNSVYVGYWLIVGLAIATASLAPQPLTYYAVGLRLRLANGENPTILHRFARSLLFWVTLVSPFTLRLDDVFGLLSVGPRERLLGAVSTDFALMALPAVSALMSAGRSSVHDVLVGTRVVRAASASLNEAKFAFGAGRGMFGVFALLWAAVLSFVMLIDWRYRLSDTVGAYFRERRSYVSEVLRGARTDPNAAIDIIRLNPPTDLYLNPDATAFFLGVTEAFRFRVSPFVLADDRRRFLAVLDEVVAIVPTMTPATKWLDIELYAEHGFGPLILDQSYFFVVDATNFKVRYAPVSQRFATGKESLSLKEWIARHSVADADTIITVFQPKPRENVGVVNLGWQFPRLDLVAMPGGPASRFVGPP